MAGFDAKTVLEHGLPMRSNRRMIADITAAGRRSDTGGLCAS